MKTKYFIFESLLFIACIFLFFSNKEGDGKNYRVKTVNRIAQMSNAPHAVAPLWIKYHMLCQDGSTGCGTGPGSVCGASETDCKPIIAYHEVTCPNDLSVRACQLVGTTSPVCGGPKACSTPPTNPTRHPLPCDYGSIAFGCFNGWVSGPYCGELVNCQTPPARAK